MATFLLMCEETERSLRKQRVFRDRTLQLETLTDLDLISRYRLTREAIFCLVGKVRPLVERPTQLLGVVDGTLIPIKRPSPNDEAPYICRKGYHAINVQAICDSSLRFTNVVAKWPGSTHDSLIWSSSQVGMRMEDFFGLEFISYICKQMLFGFYYLYRYACRHWMLTPLVDPPTKPEQKYNAAHIRTRNTVERAFGVLKSRFWYNIKITCVSFQKCNGKPDQGLVSYYREERENRLTIT
ncbi:putative nuclease HARBI1 [Haliotis rufescens]|uniref:putative nuclease HARBI1 n=1 Tax=Haliotis rufescens TaxID=6454 RepID=UPI00201EBA34|nr:putative nuclease HARBI1 [Haliotis rufescens]